MKRPNIKSAKELEAEVSKWNDAHPVGTAVKVRMDGGDIKLTTTTSEAWVMGGHSAMIKVEGISGGYMLERVSPT